MKYRIDKDWWPIHVAALEDSIKKDPDMPPLIVHYVEDDFELNDGNTRFQAYTNLGVKEVNVIVWITEEAEYQDFLKLYGKYVQSPGDKKIMEIKNEALNNFMTPCGTGKSTVNEIFKSGGFFQTTQVWTLMILIFHALITRTRNAKINITPTT